MFEVVTLVSVGDVGARAVVAVTVAAALEVEAVGDVGNFEK